MPTTIKMYKTEEEHVKGMISNLKSEVLSKKPGAPIYPDIFINSKCDGMVHQKQSGYNALQQWSRVTFSSWQELMC